MFDIFGIRAYFKAKREEKEHRLKEKKQRYQNRKKIIQDYLKDYYKKDFDHRKKEYEENQKRANELNSKCPKCGSINVINNIRRTKGEIHGESHTYHSSSSHFLSSSNFFSSGHGKIDGELDTLPINKCKDCGNEWNIEKAKFPTEHNIFSIYSSNLPLYLYDRIEEYLKMEYDPNDITDVCNSLEEKRQEYINKCRNGCMLKQAQYLPKYMIGYLVWKGMTEYHYREESLDKALGYNEKLDEFSYVTPDELWKIIKEIIDWKGEDKTI